jgi:hypothetical protein
MSDHSEFTDLIPIERLTSGLEIIIPGHGSAEVYDVEFDGDGYTVTYCYDDRYGWDALETHRVMPGECVEHAGPGAPRWLRSRAAVTEGEWEALAASTSTAPLLPCLHTR